jgi:hypothetical protein
MIYICRERRERLRGKRKQEKKKEKEKRDENNISFSLLVFAIQQTGLRERRKHNSCGTLFQKRTKVWWINRKKRKRKRVHHRIIYIRVYI